jgi:putative NIF3 family GTP cyclohydrolase 1 type 2
MKRRSFFIASAGALATEALLAQNGAQKSAAPLTAGQVIERIKANVGVPWRSQTVDTIKAGSSDTPVHGIATTMMCTLDVLERASAAGKNMVITHEPTFYSHEDKTDALVNDPTFQFKRDFIEKNGMVVFRFHDHWHAHRPDGIATGMVRALGWEKNADAQNPRLFNFTGMTLERLASEMQRKLNVRTMRVVGDPATPVSHVTASWGYGNVTGSMRALSRPEIDVLVIGEAREWEVIEYAQDVIASGKKKGLIILGHVVSEEEGMRYCADWLKGFISEVPVEFVRAGEPFWRPA